MSWVRVDGEIEHRLGRYRIRAAVDYGPRITELRHDEGPEVLASLPTHIGVTAADGELVPFHGGHRLWVAPEVVEVTYAADSSACRVEAEDERLTVIGSVDEAGFVKSISFALEEDALVVTHRLDPGPGAPDSYSAWAITQLPLGGVAILPSPRAENPGLQADRTLVAWPYTNLADARFDFREDVLLIAGHGGPNTKIGAGPNTGSLGYHREGILFTKRFEAVEGAQYPDLGAAAQVFTNEGFVELETTSPLISSGPAVHREIWRVAECATLDEAIQRVLAIA